MNKLQNLEKALVVAVLFPDFYGSKVYAMFHVTEQVGNRLQADVVWDMRQTVTDGALNYGVLGTRELDVDDICLCVQSLTPAQRAFFNRLGIDYRFYKDEDALERLALHFHMDLMSVGYDGEPVDGTWFTCCRIGAAERTIIPDGMHVYSLRASDEDDSQAASIEDRVLVNHYGDILTDRVLPVPVALAVEPVQYDDEGNVIGC